MRFFNVVLLLPVLALAAPTTQGNAADLKNKLASGINRGLDANNKENAIIQNALGAIKNKQSPMSAEDQIHSALSDAIVAREQNQAIAFQLGNKAVQDSLGNVEASQVAAQAKLNTLTSSASDLNTLNELNSLFQGEFKANEATLKLVFS